MPDEKPGLRWMTIATLLTLMWGLAAPSSARAQLGETRAEVAKRYGPIIRSHARIREHQILDGAAADSDIHEKNGLYIRVVYGQERAVQLEFSKKEGVLSAQEVETLLAGCADGSKWEPGKDSTEAIKFYRRLDGRAVASWTTDFHGSLLVGAEASAVLLQRLLS
jgi:hypothetical protein